MWCVVDKNNRPVDLNRTTTLNPKHHANPRNELDIEDKFNPNLAPHRWAALGIID